MDSFVTENGVFLITSDLFVNRQDLICDPLAYLVTAADVIHGGIGVSGDIVGTAYIGIVNGSLRVYPSDKITGTLVACGAAHGQKVDVITQFLPEEGFCATPVVGRDEAALLQNLCRAGNVCNDTGRFFVFIENIDICTPL